MMGLAACLFPCVGPPLDSKVWRSPRFRAPSTNLKLTSVLTWAPTVSQSIHALDPKPLQTNLRLRVYNLQFLCRNTLQTKIPKVLEVEDRNLGNPLYTRSTPIIRTPETSFLTSRLDIKRRQGPGTLSTLASKPNSVVDETMS